jgi:hypothetical protein
MKNQTISIIVISAQRCHIVDIVGGIDFGPKWSAVCVETWLVVLASLPQSLGWWPMILQ